MAHLIFSWGGWRDLFLGSPDLLGVCVCVVGGGGVRSPDGHRFEFKILHRRSISLKSSREGRKTTEINGPRKENTHVIHT